MSRTDGIIIGNIILAGVLFVIFICALYAFKTGVPTQATFSRDRKRFVALLKKDFESYGQSRPYTIIDLGSGGGQLACYIARAFPQAIVTGIELSPLPYLRAYITQKLFGPRNVTFLRQNFWDYDCTEANAVVLFLRKNLMEKMGCKLHRELKPGTLVIVNDDWLGDGWEPIETQHNPIFAGLTSKIFIYRA